jgi:hypothetical protein
VTGRRFAAVLVAAAALLAVCSGQAHATTTTRAWTSCKPRAILYQHAAPGYRIDADVFDGYHGTYCLSGTSSHGFRILDCAKPGTGILAGSVVAYPKIYIGQNYSSADPESELPLPATALGDLTQHVGSFGQAPGVWQSDVDDWLWPSSADLGHGSWELVIVTRQPHGHPGWTNATIAGRRWYFGPWVTHALYLMNGKVVRLSWPLIFIRAADPDLHEAAIRTQAFVSYAIRTHWLPDTAWLGQAAFGSEVWRGGCGLHDSMSVTGLLPVISQIAGTS